jgi:hypothetical protein
MDSKKFKYQQRLDKLVDCPPSIYKPVQMNAFRWIHTTEHTNSFTPMHLIKTPPPRMLDDSDLMCKGHGLSLFDTLEHGIARYKKLYKNKRAIAHQAFVEEKGDAVAMLKLEVENGVAGDLNLENGHFTFHEYDETDLSNQIVHITTLFDENGSFK